MSGAAERKISKAALRIAKRHNDVCGDGALQGGLLAFNHLGYGGAWYSAGSRPPGALVVPVSRYRMGTHEAQDLLDRYAAEQGSG